MNPNDATFDFLNQINYGWKFQKGTSSLNSADSN